MNFVCLFIYLWGLFVLFHEVSAKLVVCPNRCCEDAGPILGWVWKGGVSDCWGDRECRRIKP